MPLGEALNLAGYNRYVMTVEMLCIGIVWFILMDFVADFEWDRMRSKEGCLNNASAIGLAVVAGLLILNASGQINSLIQKPVPNSTQSSRFHLEEIVSDNSIRLTSDTRYLIYIGEPPSGDFGYRSYMSRYVLYSNHVTTVNTEKLKDYSRDKLKDYDYLIVLERDSEVIQWLVENQFQRDADVIDVNAL